MIEKTKVLEDHFKKTITLSLIRPIPSSVRFDGSRITACNASDSLILRIEQDVKLQGSGATICKGPGGYHHFESRTYLF